MKNKNVLLSLLVLVVAGCFVVLVANGISKKSNYTPRKTTDHQSGYGINGAINYLASMRNNKTTGDIDPKWVFKAREDVDKLTKSKGVSNLGISWSEVGPDNIGGRTRAILIDKTNPNIMYAGGVSGGVWKSTTGGSSWVKLDDFADNLAIASLAQGADGAIYVGTGEGLGVSDGAANGSTSFIGKGIFKSTDGVTFTSLTSTVPATGNSLGSPWAFIDRIACDPVNPLRIYAATNNGLRSTSDGGVTWVWPVKSGSNNNTLNCTDVDVATDGTVTCAIGGKCQISPNGDEGTFVNESTGGAGHLPNGGVGRIEIAIAPSDPNYMYANVAGSGGAFLNVYRSVNKGVDWSIIGPGGSSLFNLFGANNQGTYDNTIVVHPTNPDRIFVGGIDMWEWQNGQTWTQKSLWYLDPSSPWYVHADQHIYVFNPANPNIFFIGCDGGISRTIDCGETFETMNINYNTIQSYALACSSTGTIMTGCQDNGTLFLPRLGAFPKHAESVMGGDGGWSAFSFINPEAFFATTYYGDTRRSPDQGATFFPAADWSNPFFAPKMIGTSGYSSTVLPGDAAFPCAFVTPYLMWESYNDLYSSDTLIFTPLKIENEKMGKGITDSTHFSGSGTTALARGGQPSASIVPKSIHIVCGSITAHDSAGHFYGNVDLTKINTIDYNTGAYTINFSTPPASGVNILVSYEVKYDAGSSIIMESANSPAKFYYTTPVTLNFEDTAKVQDIIQSKFYMGFNNAIWMTKQALQFQKTPMWFKIAALSNSAGENTQCLALSHDGNYLFVGSSAGKLYRLSNLRMAEDSLNADISTPGCVVVKSVLPIASNSRAITSIAVDPANANNVVVTLGNYGETAYVYYSSNALDSLPTFTSKQGSGTSALPKMPVYASLIPIFHSGTVMVGTEYGIYSTPDITASSPVWSSENSGLANVPVYMLRQQQYSYPGVTNYGTIYAATHGRGIFESTQYTGIPDEQSGSNIAKEPLTVSIYPNPVSDNATLSFNLSTANNPELTVFDISGKIVKVINITNLAKGKHTYSFDCSSLRTGTYIVQLVSGSESATTKFLKLQ